jgi:hypothetical protein
MLPNFLGVGAARAGSTWIARNLEQHPDIYLPRAKELNFFNFYYGKGLEYYEGQFSGWSGEAAVGEISPEYFHNEFVASFIKKSLPDVKIIVSLRNPIERAYSHYWNLRATFPDERNLSFEERLQVPSDVTKAGFYYDHLMRYYGLFPKDKILVLLFDDLKKDPGAFLRGILSFLGVDPDWVSPLVHYRINVASSYRDLARSKSVWHLCRVLRRAKAHKLASRLERMNRTELPAMNQETKEWLVELYRDKNEMLQELISRDLSEWNSVN